MEYSKIIKEVGRGKNHARDLDEETARALYARMLNGEVPELELGGILIALRIKGEGEAEMKGFYAAMQQHTLRLTPPAGKPMPIVIPSYNGARKQANLTPLLAMLLLLRRRASLTWCSKRWALRRSKLSRSSAK